MHDATSRNYMTPTVPWFHTRWVMVRGNAVAPTSGIFCYKCYNLGTTSFLMFNSCFTCQLSSSWKVLSASDPSSSFSAEFGMIFQPMMAALSRQNFSQHDLSEVSSPWKFVSALHDGLCMHEPKSKTHLSLVS